MSAAAPPCAKTYQPAHSPSARESSAISKGGRRSGGGGKTHRGIENCEFRIENSYAFLIPNSEFSLPERQPMCGIIGYIGPKDVVPVLIDGLRRLEYRGYDSAGVAVVRDGRVELRRSAGKLSRLEDAL